jgi:glycosyltransferase involved in cell wall biosynthesis
MVSANAPKNVLNISEEFLPFYTGHAIYTVKLQRYLKRLGYQFTVVTKRLKRELPVSEIVQGVPVERLEVYDAGNFMSFYLKTIGFMIRHRSEYRVIHVNSFHDRYLLLLLVAKLLGKKVVLQMALYGTDDPLTFLRTFSLSRLRFAVMRRWTDCYFPISTPIEKSCLEAGVPARKITKIHQGVDLQRFVPAADGVAKQAVRRTLGLPEQQPLAIFVGAIIERKGVSELLEAWTKIQASVPDATLLLVGPYDFGAENVNVTSLNGFIEGLRATIAQRNLRVIWAGRTDVVEQYMAAADVFVFPSRREGLPNVIIEAMSCELPCVTTSMFGAADDMVVPGETGYIVGGVDELAERTTELLKDPAKVRAMGSRGREVALRKFDFENIASRYVKLYDSLQA